MILMKCPYFLKNIKKLIIYLSHFTKETIFYDFLSVFPVHQAQRGANSFLLEFREAETVLKAASPEFIESPYYHDHTIHTNQDPE